MMDIEYIGKIIGYIASIIATMSFLPQAHKAYKSQSCKDLSWGWIIMFCVSNSLWLIYGIIFNLFPIVIANATILLCMIYMTFVKTMNEYIIILQLSNKYPMLRRFKK